MLASALYVSVDVALPRAVACASCFTMHAVGCTYHISSILREGRREEWPVIRCPDEGFETVGITVLELPLLVFGFHITGCTRAGIRVDTHLTKEEAMFLHQDVGNTAGDTPPPRSGASRAHRDALALEAELREIRFENNTRAIAVMSDNLRVSDCEFINNVHPSQGSVLRYTPRNAEGQAVMQRCLFRYFVVH